MPVLSAHEARRCATRNSCLEVSLLCQLCSSAMCEQIGAACIEVAQQCMRCAVYLCPRVESGLFCTYVELRFVEHEPCESIMACHEIALLSALQHALWHQLHDTRTQQRRIDLVKRLRGDLCT